MDLSTPQRFKRIRERGSPNEEIKISKVRLNGIGSNNVDDENDGENTENEDIFNNEEMENPPDDDNGVARFLTPPRRSSPNGAGGASAAGFYDERMDEDVDAAEGENSDASKMRDIVV